MFATVVEVITTILTIASLAYCAAALWSAWRFARRRAAASAHFTPPVSVLKPLKGFDHSMVEAFASHCRQDYTGEIELLFGVSSMDDPAVEAVHRLQAEFPMEDIRLVLCPERLGLNGKVNNVAQLARAARHDYLIVNDSDIHVSPSYLRRVMSGFAVPEHHQTVGLVTVPYRGLTHGVTDEARATIGSKLEALGISTDFMPGVLTALTLEGGIQFGLGSTLAVSRAALVDAGGFESLVNTLSDDYELGFRVARAGYAVVLSPEVVETSVPPYTFREFFSHQLRWARSVRDSREAGYLGLIFTFALPWAFFNMIASGFDNLSLALLAAAVAARIAVALTIGTGLLEDRQTLRDLWLLPLRDFCALWTWIWSFAGHTVEWRGEKFELNQGRLVKLSSDK